MRSLRRVKGWTAGPAALLAALAFSAHAATVSECRDAAGKTRLTDRPCREGEETVSSRELRPRPPAPAPAVLDHEEEPTVSTATPAGLRPDGAGGALRYEGTRWTLVNTLRSYSWSAAGGWVDAGPVEEDKRLAIRNAVEKFNAIPGLRLKLDYSETSDPAYSIANASKHRDEFVVFWAEDADRGGLTRPFTWNEKHGYKGGCSTYLAERGGGRQVIRGAAIFARERIRKKTDLARCRQDAPYYAFLHEIGHALGLGHATPRPSIMSGSCGMEYLPNDVANLRRLYGGT